MSDVSRVLVVAPNWLGDAVMALPAIADVRRHFAGARLAVAARGALAPMYQLAPDVDEIVTLEWRGGLLSRTAMHHDVEHLRAAAPGIAILLPNSFASAWLARTAGVRERWGYASDLRGPLLTHKVRRPSGSVHQGSYYQHLVRSFGVPSGPLEPRLDVPTAAIEAARGFLAARGWDASRPHVVVAPGAAYGTAKRWLPAHFGRLITRTVLERGMQPVLVGSAGDRETADWVVRSVDAAARARVIDVTGATSIELLAAVLRLASACVSNDSGAMHLAGAVGTPLAALFGPTRDRETAPLARAGARAEVLTNPVWCRPCMLRECPIDHRCMKGIAPDRVFAAVDRLMAGAPQ